MSAMPPRLVRRHPAPARLLLTAVLAALLPGPARAADPAAPPAPAVTEVRVERVRPPHEKLATLRFLKENRAFFRARLDQLRQTPHGGRGDATAIDPRFLAYQRMLAEVGAARDSAAGIDQDRQSRGLFASINDLGQLESQLDQMERMLADQRARLGVLQGDFNGLQRTALAIVLSGYPRGAALSTVAITLEDGHTLAVPLSAEQRESLQHGAVLQVFHGLVEPRSQVVEVTLAGDRWPQGDSGFVALEPPRDRLTLLRLNLSAVEPAAGAGSIVASTWLHDAELHAHDTRSEP
jgi:hypothetical protein